MKILVVKEGYLLIKNHHFLSLVTSLNEHAKQTIYNNCQVAGIIGH